MWAALLLGLVTLLFLLPLLPALQELRQRRDVQPLRIVPGHHGDIRQFADGFRSFISGELTRRAEGAADEGWAAAYAFIDHGQGFQPTADEARRRQTQRVLVAAQALSLPDNFTFLGEIYGRKHLRSGLRNQLRGVLVEHDLLLLNDSTVLRWAHARTAFVARGCYLLGRLSVVESAVLDSGCRFVRVNAGCILFGAGPHPPWPGPDADGPPLQRYRPAPGELLPDGRLLRTQVLQLPANSYYQGDLIVYGDVVIGAGSRIDGSIKSHGDLVLHDGVRISGALACDHALSVGADCTVAGPVIAEGKLLLGARTVIGTPAQPSTVTATVICATVFARVYGSAWAREEGVVIPVLPFAGRRRQRGDGR